MADMEQEVSLEELEAEEEVSLADLEAEEEMSLADLEVGLETAPAQPPLTPEELPTAGESTKQFVSEQIEGVMPASSVALGLGAATHGAGALYGKTKAALKEGLDPDRLQYLGAGGDMTPAQRMLDPKAKQKIGKFLGEEGLSKTVSSAESRYADVKHKLKQTGEAIGLEQKSASYHINKLDPGAKKALELEIGKTAARGFRQIADDLELSSTVKSDVATRKGLDRIIKKYQKGLSLDDLKKDMKGFSREAKFIEHGVPKNPAAALQRKVLQDIRIPIIEDVLKTSGEDTSNLRALNKRYAKLSEAKGLLEAYKKKIPLESSVSATAKLARKGVKASLLHSISGGVTAMFSVLADTSTVKTLERALASAQKGKTGEMLKMITKVAEGTGKLAKHAIPAAGFLATYNMAKAEGATSKEAFMVAAGSEGVEAIPVVGQAKQLGEMALWPTSTGPEEGLQKKMETGGEMTPEEVKSLQSQHGFDPAKYAPGQVEVEPEVTGRRARMGLSNPLSKAKPSDVKKTYELPRNIQEMDESSISKTLQSLEASGNTSFTGPLKRALEGDEDTRRAMLFMLTQRPVTERFIRLKRRTYNGPVRVNPQGYTS